MLCLEACFLRASFVVRAEHNQANAPIEELWEQLHHYEDKLKTSCSNSSKPPSSNGPKEQAKQDHSGDQRQLSKLNDTVPQGIMGPNLLSYIAVLAGQYDLSISKISSL